MMTKHATTLLEIRNSLILIQDRDSAISAIDKLVDELNNPSESECFWLLEPESIYCNKHKCKITDCPNPEYHSVTDFITTLIQDKLKS